MKGLRSLYFANKWQTALGGINLLLALLFAALAIVNQEVITGLNSMIKPMKFSLSIGVYGISMGILLRYFNNQKLVRNYSIAGFFAMMYEQFAIILQAFRGQVSHFNRENIFGVILYMLMGVAITLYGESAFLLAKQGA